MTVVTEPLTIAIRLPIEGRTWLHADVYTPPRAKALVLLAHGSGSSRHSPNNHRVAFALDKQQIATVVVDLLTDDEEKLDERTGALRFDAGLLTRRLMRMVEWSRTSDLVGGLPLALVGTNAAAAAALDAAAVRPDVVRAVVCTSGRPDLALRLGAVKAPTLLIVGGNDPVDLELNAIASRIMTCA
ncbi:MAG TPA: hydrolase, partial [Thermoanaerobaculia bacterium]|nr:hydrolase [Thermoanaerobaculia bacterium]